MKKTTVFLSEDHLIVRKGLKALIELEKDMTVVGEADNGLDAVKMVKHLAPMVVIMDIALPKLNGIEASRKILKENPSTKILVLSAYADDGYIEKMTSIGVSGFLIKQCSPNILIEAIREIRNGNVFFSPMVSDRLKKMDGFSKKTTQALSEREVQVLQLITEGKANKEVAFELEISIKTIEKHRQSIMKKLSIHDVAGLTRYAIAEGIIECNRPKKINE
ncbi:MAG: DNA-binding response regulator [Bdellovibrionales bacterium GWA2_49_15]|nr:MAG: DNA-binding response regulator [Bdellovibrionales bacterium GWA2_49_15]HAZ11969.1 DNA-binding response regulator [Bdellovibrionales bacterium]